MVPMAPQHHFESLTFHMQDSGVAGGSDLLHSASPGSTRCCPEGILLRTSHVWPSFIPLVRKSPCEASAQFPKLPLARPLIPPAPCSFLCGHRHSLSWPEGFSPSSYSLPNHHAAPQHQNLLVLPAVSLKDFISQDTAHGSPPSTHSSRLTSSHSVLFSSGSMHDYTFLTIGSLSYISLEVTGLGLD